MNSHGANIFEISKKNNIDLNEIMDFSSNINPLGPSKKALDFLKENLNLLSAYPDVDYVDLKNSISNYTSADSKNIVLGLGSTDILKDSIKFFSPQRAMILSPCYSEYERELKSIGAEVFEFNLKESTDFKVDVDEIILAIHENKIELLVFANPNNPTGTIFTRNEIEKILKETEVNFIIDETYVEFTDMEIFSSTELIDDYENIIVVRGTSKFFGLPGIRLGYGLTSNKELLKNYEENETLWEINSAADICGRVMFSDEEYIKKVFNFIKTEREKILQNLKDFKNLRAFESYGNFILVKILDGPDSTALREKLIEDKIIIRDCKTFKNLDDSFFRFCILGKDENELLIEKLREIYEVNND